MHTLLQDVRYALRLMWKSPGFTAVAVVTLALGIGANTAIFTVLDAALTRSLPFEEPDRLVTIPMTKGGEFNQMEASYPNYLDWVERQRSFVSVAGYGGGGGVLATKEGPQLVNTATVSPSFFSTLGVEASVGRTFAPADDKPEAPRTVLLTHGFWQRQFGGDQRIVGSTIPYDDAPHTVIGVLPADFQFAPVGAVDMFEMPPSAGDPRVVRRNLHWFNVIGRLKPGVTREQAHADMASISAALAQQYPTTNADTSTGVLPLGEQVMGNVRPVLLALLGAVGFVLLIACVNVANLVLSRSVNRQREIGVRLALGAGSGRLIRQLLTESTLLALFGGAVGLMLAFWGVDLLIAAIPTAVLSGMPYFQNLSLDPRALAFTFSVATITGLLFGLVPALHLSRASTHDTLKEGAAWSSGSRSTHRLRDALVVSQVALAAILLIGAGLMIKSLASMMQVDPGFDYQNLLTLRIVMPMSKYAQPEQRIVLERELRTRLAALPGVKTTATTSTLPLSGGGNTIRYLVEGRGTQSAGEQPEANIRNVSPGYFQAMGATLRAGREFTEQDTGTSPFVLIVNRPLAEQMFSGEDAVGKRLTFTFAPDQPAREIVGVVEEVKEGFLDSNPRPAIYTPYAQGAGGFRNIAIRTSGRADDMVAAVRNQVLAIEPQMVIFSISSMEQRVADAPATFFRRYPALLSGVFAAVALLLAMIGVYGVLAYSVSQRTRELGIRIALGAQRGDLLRLVMGKGLQLTVIGTLLGIVGAAGMSRLIANLLFGVRPTDVITFVSIPVLMLLTTLAACYLPARRAAKVDPIVALRYE
jgi:putative ABC transport system permease protein